MLNPESQTWRDFQPIRRAIRGQPALTPAGQERESGYLQHRFLPPAVRLERGERRGEERRGGEGRVGEGRRRGEEGRGGGGEKRRGRERRGEERRGGEGRGGEVEKG